MFSEEFRRHLLAGKHTRWATGLTEQDLYALLWLVGEYGARAPLILDLVERHRGEVATRLHRFARAKVALELIAQVVSGCPVDMSQVWARICETKAERRPPAC